MNAETRICSWWVGALVAAAVLFGCPQPALASDAEGASDGGAGASVAVLPVPDPEGEPESSGLVAVPYGEPDGGSIEEPADEPTPVEVDDDPVSTESPEGESPDSNQGAVGEPDADTVPDEAPDAASSSPLPQIKDGEAIADAVAQAHDAAWPSVVEKEVSTPKQSVAALERAGAEGESARSTKRDRPVWRGPADAMSAPAEFSWPGSWSAVPVQVEDAIEAQPGVAQVDTRGGDEPAPDALAALLRLAGGSHPADREAVEVAGARAQGGSPASALAVLNDSAGWYIPVFDPRYELPVPPLGFLVADKPRCRSP